MPALEEHRAKIEDFLKAQSLENFGLKDQELVVASETLTPVQGFELLASKHLRACPVRSACGNEIIGTLDLRDICKFFVDEHRKTAHSPAAASGTKVSEPLRKLVLDAITCHPDLQQTDPNLRLQKLTFQNRYLAKMRPFKIFAPSASALEVARGLSGGRHIVGISTAAAKGSDSATAESASSEGCALGLSKVVNQKSLFALLAPALHEVDLPITAVMTSPVISVTSDTPAFKVFEIMASKGVSGVAVVDEESGQIIHNTSVKDVKLWIAPERRRASLSAEAADPPAPPPSMDDPIESFLVALRARADSSAKTRVPVPLAD